MFVYIYKVIYIYMYIYIDKWIFMVLQLTHMFLLGGLEDLAQLLGT